MMLTKLAHLKQDSYIRNKRTKQQQCQLLLITLIIASHSDNADLSEWNTTCLDLIETNGKH